MVREGGFCDVYFLILDSSRFYTLPPHCGKMNINYDRETGIIKRNEFISGETDQMIFIQFF